MAELHKTEKDLNAALCNFCNSVGDPFEPVETWSEEVKLYGAELSRAYNEWYKWLRATDRDPFLSSSAARENAVSQWQPFETAPKDGTEVLIASIRHGVRVARYQPWIKGCEWFIGLNPGPSGGTYTNDVTHWMPVPNFP